MNCAWHSYVLPGVLWFTADMTEAIIFFSLKLNELRTCPVNFTSGRIFAATLARLPFYHRTSISFHRHPWCKPLIFLTQSIWSKAFLGKLDEKRGKSGHNYKNLSTAHFSCFSNLVVEREERLRQKHGFSSRSSPARPAQEQHETRFCLMPWQTRLLHMQLFLALGT